MPANKQSATVKTKGSITLPAEVGEEGMVVELARKWGADAIRDSDGTELSQEMLDLGLEVYSTTCLVRAEQTYPRRHMDQLPQKFLMSDPVTATAKSLVIDPMSGFYREKYVIDLKHPAKKYWEVIDRTTGEVVPVSKWKLDARTGTVAITGTVPFHVYTVNFLVFQIWDTTSMYNHLTNNWDKPHVISVDPYHKECWNHLMAYYDKYLENHPQTDVVRLTTLAYHFAVDSDQDSVDKFRDWTGYQDTISVLALEDFAKEHGYRLRGEDFVDEGYYNAACRVPGERYLAWMRFIHKFVVRFGKALVDQAHKAGTTTAMCWGDNYFRQLGDGTRTNRTRPTPVRADATTVLTGATLQINAGLTLANSLTLAGTGAGGARRQSGHRGRSPRGHGDEHSGWGGRARAVHLPDAGACLHPV